MTRSSRSALGAIVLGLTLITGCTSNAPEKPDWTGASEGNRNNDGAPPVAKNPGHANGQTTPPNGDGKLCDDPEAKPGRNYDAFCNDTEFYPGTATDKRLGYKPGLKPKSTDYAGRVNVQSYLLDVMQSQRSLWQNYFKGSGVQVPSFGTDVVSGNERYKSNCPNGEVFGEPNEENAVIVTADSPRALYCPMDGQSRSGHIALPANTFAKLWKKGRDREVSDMAAAIAASRVSSQVLNQALLTQHAGGSMERFLVSSCLAGMWARGAYSPDDASERDEALAYAKQIPSEIGYESSPDARSMDRAWQAGFNNGDPNTCARVSVWINEQ